jgi:hypothetical protein
MDRFFGRAGLALAIGLGSLMTAGASWAVQPPASVNVGAAETFGLQGPAVTKAAKPARPTPSEKAKIALGGIPEVRLQALDTDALLREDALAGGRVKGALRYGVGRNLQVSIEDGSWYDLADGSRLWIGEVVSTGALGMRVHFKDVRLPAGAELAVYAPGGSDPARGIVKSGSPLDDPDRYVEFYEASAYTKSQFWTGSFLGDRVRIEYQVPAGEVSEALPFGVDRLQHLYIDPVNRLAKSLVSGKAAGSCENDVTCSPEWQDLSHAVSGIGFIGDNALYCTGQLLNSQAQDFTPYWLTANHCMDNAGDAESAEFFWFYQTSQCNGNPPSLASTQRSRGATLLSTNPVSDYTLLMINGALPDGLYWAGWTGKAVPEGTDATAVHHPAGDYKRISFGFKDNPSGCYEFNGTNGLQLVQIDWLDGVTEPGSSGSGIFRSDTQQLFGQLFFGPSSCNASSGDRFDCYGSFVTTYGKIKNFLKVGSDDKSEQNDSCQKAKKLNAGTQGGRVVKVVDPDWYKVTVPAHRTVNIDLGFSNANGDIDLAAYASCNSDPIVTSTGANDGEGVSLVNNGNKAATVFFQVYLSSSTRNTYDVHVSFE